MKLRSMIWVAALFVLPLGSASQARRPDAVTGQSNVVKVITAHGERKFMVEIARTDAEQARGLMFRKHLDADKGMIFPMKPPHPVAFWMENTLIPLDIIFISPDGRIESIKANARPLDTTPLPSGGSVSAVLEVAGGTALRMGIKPGDKFVW